MAKQGAVYKKSLAYTVDQDSHIERVWGTINAMAPVMLANAKLPAMRYT